MGTLCCRNDRSDSLTEINLVGASDTDRSLADKKSRPLTPEMKARLAQLVSNVKKNRLALKKLTKLQAWFRSIKIRKLYPTAKGLKPIAVVHYISDKLAATSEAVALVEKKLGPFVVDWDIKGQQHPILELRKPVAESTGEIYCGYWNKQTGQKEGYGQQIYNTGAKYEGMWKNGSPEGLGRYIYENGDYYVGTRMQGKASGEGTFVSVSGDKYEGGWKADQHHGKGKETRPDGAVYEGNFVEGKKEGKGKFSWPDGSWYEGDFAGNSLSGEGTYRWADGRTYQGGWKENKMNGKGTFKYSDGKIYAGEFANDLRHGYGTMTWYLPSLFSSVEKRKTKIEGRTG